MTMWCERSNVILNEREMTVYIECVKTKKTRVWILVILILMTIIN